MTNPCNLQVALCADFAHEMSPTCSALDVTVLHPAHSTAVQYAMLDLLFEVSPLTLPERLARYRILLDGATQRVVEAALHDNAVLFRTSPRVQRALNEVYMFARCTEQLDYYVAKYRVPRCIGDRWKANMRNVENLLRSGHTPESSMAALADVCCAVLRDRLCIRA